MTRNATVRICAPTTRDGAVDVAELRRVGADALALRPAELVVDLRHVSNHAEAIRALHDVQAEACDHHCQLTFELPRLNISVDCPDTSDVPRQSTSSGEEPTSASGA